MIRSKILLPLLLFMASCGPEVDDTMPSRAQQEEMAWNRCEQLIACELLSVELTPEKCRDYLVANYDQSEDCLERRYAFDECVIDHSCEELETLIRTREGRCEYEYDRVTELEHMCIPPDEAWTGP